MGTCMFSGHSSFNFPVWVNVFTVNYWRKRFFSKREKDESEKENIQNTGNGIGFIRKIIFKHSD